MNVRPKWMGIIIVSSSISQQQSVPETKINLDNRTFSVPALKIWNDLPIPLKSFETIASFHRNLRTFFILPLRPKSPAVLRSGDDFCVFLFMTSCLMILVCTLHL